MFFEANREFFFGSSLLDDDLILKRGSLVLFKEDNQSFNHKLFLRLFASVNNIQSGLSSDEDYLEIPVCIKNEPSLENLSLLPTAFSYKFDFTEVAYRLPLTDSIEFPSVNFIITGLFSPVFNEKYNICTEEDFYRFLFSLKKHVLDGKLVCAVSIPTFLYPSINFPFYFTPVLSLSMYNGNINILHVERGGRERSNRTYTFTVKSDRLDCEYYTDQPIDIAPMKKNLSEDF